MWHGFWIWVYVNSQTVQAVSAAFGAIGLALYVLYTKHMRDVSLITQRLTMTPYLIPEFEGDQEPLIKVINVAAPAVLCEVWAQIVSSDYVMRFKVRPYSGAKITRYAAITKDLPIQLEMVRTEDYAPILYVMTFRDTGGSEYQLQLLLKSMPNGNVTVQAHSLAPDSILPFWHRWPRRAWEIVVLQSSKRRQKRKVH